MTLDYPMTWEQAVEWLRNDPAQQDLVRACFFDDPALEAAKRFHASSEWQATRALFLHPPGRALDIGAGRGIATYALAVDGWEVTAVEPNPSTLIGVGAIREIMAEGGQRVRIITETGEDLSLPDACMDLVYCRQALHHAADLDALCRQIARILKRGGCLVATREHVLSRREDLQAFLESHPLHSKYGGEHAYLLSEYRHALEEAGLRIIQCLNPLQSDINLYPMTVADHKRLVAERYHLPTSLIPHFVMTWLGERLDIPGRLYTFVAHKP